MNRVHSFEPVIGRDPRILILGSMPGTASLQAVQYYAHPRNAFWPIMAELFALDREVEYAVRIRQIERRPVILWDTLKRCHRPGSLDSNIDRGSVEANAIPELLQRHETIRAIVFNGATSENYFRKLVLPKLQPADARALLRMPSTSPANAGMSFEQKLEQWKRLLDYLG